MLNHQGDLVNWVDVIHMSFNMRIAWRNIVVLYEPRRFAHCSIVRCSSQNQQSTRVSHRRFNREMRQLHVFIFFTFFNLQNIFYFMVFVCLLSFYLVACFAFLCKCLIRELEAHNAIPEQNFPQLLTSQVDKSSDTCIFSCLHLTLWLYKLMMFCPWFIDCLTTFLSLLRKGLFHCQLNHPNMFKIHMCIFVWRR